MTGLHALRTAHCHEIIVCSGLANGSRRGGEQALAAMARTDMKERKGGKVAWALPAVTHHWLA